MHIEFQNSTTRKRSLTVKMPKKKTRQMTESGSEYCNLNLMGKKLNVAENAAAICKKVPDKLTISVII